MSEIQELAKLKGLADRAYYNSGNSIMDDGEYDAIVERIREIDSSHPCLEDVGAEVSGSIWPKQSHDIPMGSLSKAKNADGIRDWWQKTEAKI